MHEVARSDHANDKFPQLSPGPDQPYEVTIAKAVPSHLSTIHSSTSSLRSLVEA